MAKKDSAEDDSNDEENSTVNKFQQPTLFNQQPYIPPVPYRNNIDGTDFLTGETGDGIKVNFPSFDSLNSVPVANTLKFSKGSEKLDEAQVIKAPSSDSKDNIDDKNTVTSKKSLTSSSLVKASKSKNSSNSKADSNIVYWIGGSGFWDDSNNWSTGKLPGSTDEVIIDVPSEVVITYREGLTSIAKLTTQEDLVISGGSLTILKEGLINNEFTLSNKGILNTTGTINIVGKNNEWSGGKLSGKGIINIDSIVGSNPRNDASIT